MTDRPGDAGRLPRRKFLFSLAGALLLAGAPRRLRASRHRSQPSARPDGLPLTLTDELDKFWQNARKEVYKSVPELMARHHVELERGVRFHKLIRGPRDKRHVAITFDDGPHPGYTPRLLSILKDFDAKATFFVVGEVAERYPELVRSESAAGHSIGNHTYHHVDLTKIPQDYVATEIKACGEVLAGITGRRPHLFRPPGGDYNHDVATVAEALGYTMVLWTDDPGDYASPGKDLIKQRLLNNISEGGIVLIHDGIEQTIAILPDVLKYLKMRNFDLVTVDEMLRDHPLYGPLGILRTRPGSLRRARSTFR